MKLVLVITDFGSFNNFLSELSLEFLKNSDNKLHVICDNSKVIKLKDKYNYQIPNLTFHFVPFSRGSGVLKTVATAFRIRKIIKLLKPDLVHAHFTTGIFPTILLRKRGIKFWGTFHGLGMNSAEGWKNKLVFSTVEILCFLRLNRIFVVNSQDFEMLRQLGFSKRLVKYNCFGFGCDIEEFNTEKYSEDFRKSLRDTLRIRNEFVLTFTGRFVKFKGFDVAIRAYMKLSKNFPDRFILMLIGGEDKEHPTGLTKEENDFIKNSNSVRNIGFTNEVAKYLSITDTFLFPSKKEGLPTCVMEALAMNVPVIVSDSRGSNDIVVNRHNGYLIENGSNEVDDIISIIIKLSENNDMVERIRDYNRIERERFSRQRFIDYHIDMYQKIKKEN